MKTTVVIGGGTMGADIALTLARAGHATHLVEPVPACRGTLPQRLADGLASLGCPHRLERIALNAALSEVPWGRVDAVIEAVPEDLALKRRIFSELVRLARPGALLTSNSSALPISAIGEGLATRERMFGLHYFMPAHSVPLVEVVLSEASDAVLADELCAFMRTTGKIPVKVRKDVPGFLANRLQHALCREAFAMIDAGIVTPEDVDLAVRFSFGFRYLAVGPVLQRDHAGLDVHCAAAATIYPSLSKADEPAGVLRRHVAEGHLGIKAGRGFFEWTPAKVAAEKRRYEALLRGALKLIESELPPVDDRA